MKEDAKLRRRFNYDNTYNFYKIMKDQQTDAGTNSWAIRWYWTNFKRDGYILSPLHSLVSNEGWDGSGVHCGESREPVFDHHLAERPEVHRLMKRALLHESEPNLLKHIYHIVFRRNYIGQI